MNAIHLFLFLATCSGVLAFPNGSGHCNRGGFSGQRSTFGAHQVKGPGMHTHAAGGVKITVDGQEISSDQLRYLKPNQEYNFRIGFHCNTPFKGFLVRAEGMNNEDLSTSFSALDEHTKVSDHCDPNIGALTHKSSSYKNEIEFIFKHAGMAPKIRLDVTVLRNGGRDTEEDPDRAYAWFHDVYELVLDNADHPVVPSPLNPASVSCSPSAPTSSPPDYASPTGSPTGVSTFHPTAVPTKSSTAAPTKMPSKIPSPLPTSSPSKISTKSPTVSPTKAPTVSPTKGPTIAPSKRPTLSPTKNPTVSPTKAPSKMPTLSPVKTPTKSPTRSPSQAPTASTPADEVYAVPNIIDSKGYQLAYALDIPVNPNYGIAAPDYSVNNSLGISNFSRIAYYMELNNFYVWVSMDAFTDNARKIGVPCLHLDCGDGITPTVIQQMVSNMNIESNVYGLTGSNLSGNVEFWPYNYGPGNAINIPGASASAFDFGDEVQANGSFGSMQVHVNGGGSYVGTVFAFNKFNDGTAADLGMSNMPSNSGYGLGPDWSLALNSASWNVRKLKVFVKDEIPAIPNIQDSNGYQLAYSLDIPTNPAYGSIAPQYSVDNSLSLLDFSKVAYYLELDNSYVWVSMDAFTSDARKIGVPCLHLGCGDGVTPTVIQQLVSNMNVVSNMPGLTGSNLSGNVEFWPYNYSPGNSINIPGASASAFDFGDQAESHGTFGSMQVHVNGGGSYIGTVFAFNRFNDGAVADLGIGNKPSYASGLGPDWSLASNSYLYGTRKLRVYVK